MENNFITPTHKPTNWIYSLWIPLLVPLGLFVVDRYLVTAAFVLPLLLFLLISCLAFRLPAWQVALWSAAYAASLFLIYQFETSWTKTADSVVPYLRTIGFLVSGTVATMLASHRSRLEKSHQALFGIISALPTAVIVSDILGNILFLNNAAEKMLKGRINELSGVSYFSTFISPEEQGEKIAQYVSYFGPNHTGVVQMTLRTRENPPLILKATLTVVQLDKSQYAVTVIERVEEMTEAGARNRLQGSAV